ncbi:fumarate/nitrate reduction transcriptional regulator Fnr [Pseudomonas sp. R-28-1W-6]|uniref:fumarate/nitrate reduction transcriptional regulator Fnr n=1 Tax=Pseudomonas sp. R-28-1W-6 TaxID=2650101 RepID=UPI001365D9F6|nr:fumarate/nitrate reduction transcriptional regulator Fnr [Pseudomonas sp. R-28-1W-6]MWV13614.1 fumarate/nitrate reduction transcriptional regulator Fnr [Pseudomonas sp. R-28-1W-6]
MPADKRHAATRPAAESPVNCHSCSISRLCLPFSLRDTEIAQLEGIVRRNPPLHKGDYLFRAGEPMRQVFAVRCGSLKTFLLNPEGSEQITGFHLPGELLGLDALGTEHYLSYAVALETSLVCSISFALLEELAGSIPLLRKRLLTTLSREIHAEQEHLGHSRESAEQRLAAFLVQLSLRYSQLGRSAQAFSLPMSRGEIGNYLGLTTETVSRLFTRYRNSGLIRLSGREIQLTDLPALQQMGAACA